MKKYEMYEHHNGMVWVRTDLKGTHRDNCLCFACKKFHPDHDDNCMTADELYEFCIRWNMTTPVFECPEFVEKNK